MKKTIFFIAILITAVLVSGAPKGKLKVERPDMEKIKREVNDPRSPSYYPRLMERYEKNETIMNLQDYRNLYYGMVFQEDYNPYRVSEYDHKIDELYFKSSHTKAELDSIERYARLALEDDPFDLNQINFLIYALRKRGKINLANIWQYRLNHLIAAILSSGNGLDKNNAWLIIDPKHEYNIVNFQNAKVEDVELREPYYDYVTVSPQEKGSVGKHPKGYYFDVRYVLEEYNRKFPPEDEDFSEE